MNLRTPPLDSGPYTPRLVDAYLDRLLPNVPAVLLAGPRGSGKTTTAMRRATSLLDLGDDAIARVANADPREVLARFDTPVVVDEWQLAPNIMGAIKFLVDQRATNNQFIVTGSSRADQTHAAWPATGRLVRLPMWGMTRREIVGNAGRPSIVDLMFEDKFSELLGPHSTLTQSDYVDMIVTSGFPSAQLINDPEVRALWISSYVDSLIARDVDYSLGKVDTRKFQRYLTAIASTTATNVSEQSLASAADVTRITAQSYRAILNALYVVEDLPAWSNNKLKQLAKTPKLHLIEPAIAPAILRQNTKAILNDAATLGRLTESFVVAQLRPELAYAATQPSAYHFRDARGAREIDLLLESADGRIVAIEIKASTTVSVRDAKHLTWLQGEIGDKFVGGVVFHMGQLASRITPDIYALPISQIWS